MRRVLPVGRKLTVKAYEAERKPVNIERLGKDVDGGQAVGG